MEREQWKSVLVKSGALCAITAGVALMQQWSASSWVTREQVRV